MNHPLTNLPGPEATLVLLSALLFWFCSRCNSGEGRDIAVMDKLKWAIPFITTPIAFATICAPYAKNWWWLGRAIVFTYMAIMVCGYRVISGLGSGSKGQDVALILQVVLGAAAIAIATAVTVAMILAAPKPGFANWFHAHKILGTLFSALAMLPIGLVRGRTVTVVGAILLGLYAESFKR
jgi:hypothetical protein